MSESQAETQATDETKPLKPVPSETVTNGTKADSPKDKEVAKSQRQRKVSISDSPSKKSSGSKSINSPEKVNLPSTQKTPPTTPEKNSEKGKKVTTPPKGTPEKLPNLKTTEKDSTSKVSSPTKSEAKKLDSKIAEEPMKVNIVEEPIKTKTVEEPTKTKTTEDAKKNKVEESNFKEKDETKNGNNQQKSKLAFIPNSPTTEDSKIAKIEIVISSPTNSALSDISTETSVNTTIDLSENLSKDSKPTKDTSESDDKDGTKDDDSKKKRRHKKITVPSNATKEYIRNHTWWRLERSRSTLHPRPCNNRIPHFRGELQAIERLVELEQFKNAKVIKVNLDKSQESVRFTIVESRKEFIVGCPGLQEAVFLHVKPPVEPSKSSNRLAASRMGINHVGTALDFGSENKADMIIIGSVAVDKSGRRIGKGEGFSDLEYALLKKLGGMRPDAPIVTLVHDLQVYESLPDGIFKSFDVPVDIIVTPTRVIEVESKRSHPELMWNRLSSRRVSDISIMKHLMDKDKTAGLKVELMDVESDTDQDEKSQGQYWYRPYVYRRSQGYNNMGYMGPVIPRGNMNRQRVYSGYQQHPINNYYPQPMRSRQAYPQNYIPYYPQQQYGYMGPPPRGNQGRAANQRAMQYPQGLPQGGRAPQASVGSGLTRNTRGPGPVNQRRQRYSTQTISSEQPNSPASTTNGANQGSGIKKNRRERRRYTRSRSNLGFTLKVGGLSAGVRVKDLKAALVDRGVRPTDISWRGPKGIALLHFAKNRKQTAEMDQVLLTLEGLKVQPVDGPEMSLKIEAAAPKPSVDSTTGSS